MLALQPRGVAIDRSPWPSILHLIDPLQPPLRLHPQADRELLRSKPGDGILNVYSFHRLSQSVPDLERRAHAVRQRYSPTQAPLQQYPPWNTLCGGDPLGHIARLRDADSIPNSPSHP